MPDRVAYRDTVLNDSVGGVSLNSTGWIDVGSVSIGPSDGNNRRKELLYTIEIEWPAGVTPGPSVGGLLVRFVPESITMGDVKAMRRFIPCPTTSSVETKRYSFRMPGYWENARVWMCWEKNVIDATVDATYLYENRRKVEDA